MRVMVSKAVTNDEGKVSQRLPRWPVGVTDGEHDTTVVVIIAGSVIFVLASLCALVQRLRANSVEDTDNAQINDRKTKIL